MNLAVVVCGPIASGKTTAISFLSSMLDLKVVSFGGYVRSAAEQSGCPETRETLQDLGESLLESMGAADFLEAALRFADVNDGDAVIFDGVRHLEILTEIRRSFDSVVAFYLAVSREERYRRYNIRQPAEIAFDDFLQIETHPVEVGVAALKGHCETVIDASQCEEGIKNVLKHEIRSHGFSMVL